MDIFSSIILLILSIGLVCLACFLFNNAMEWLAKIYELSEGTIGSVLSVIGTSLPQMVVPLIAFIFFRQSETIQIGVGTIIGTPFVLSTLGFGLIGATIITLAKKGERSSEIDADQMIISRNLKFFLITYSFAVFSGLLITEKAPKIVVGFIVLMIYVYYIYRNVVYEEMAIQEMHTPLFFSPRGEEITLQITFVQLILSLVGLIGGGYLFVYTMKDISLTVGAQSQLAALILAIILVPMVIEIPSKFNTIIWLRESKDTLALADIISGMVFQACVLVMIGILFSPWKFEGISLLVGSIPLISTALTYITITWQEKINPYVLLGCGGFYLVFLASLFFIKF